MFSLGGNPAALPYEAKGDESKRRQSKLIQL
jgi:hypothetical protein